MNKVLRVVFGLIILAGKVVFPAQQKPANNKDARIIVNQLIPQADLSIGDAFVLEKEVQYIPSSGVRLAPLKGQVGDEVIALDPSIDWISITLKNRKTGEAIFEQRKVGPNDDIGTLNAMQGNKIKQLVSMKLGRGDDVVAFSIVPHRNAIDVRIVNKNQDTSIMYDFDTGAVIDEGLDILAKFAKHTAGFDTEEIGKRIAPVALKELRLKSDAFKAVERLIFSPVKLYDVQGDVQGFSPNGAAFATSFINNIMRVYDTATGNQLGPDFIANEMKFSFDRKGAVLLQQHDTIALYDISTGNKIGPGLDNDLNAILSPDGTKVALPSEDRNTMKVYDIATGKQIGVDMPGWKAVFSPNKIMVAVYDGEGHSDDDIVRVYNLLTGNKIGPDFKGVDAVFSPDGKSLAVSFLLTTQIYDIANGNKIGGRLEGFNVLFSPDGKKFLVGNSDDYESAKMRLYDVATGKQAGVDLQASFAVFSPDGKQMALVNADQYVIRLYDVATLNQIGGPFEGDSVAFSPDGTKLAVDNAVYSLEGIRFLNNIKSVVSLRLLEAFGLAIQESNQKPNEPKRRIILTPEQKATFKTFPKVVARVLLPYVGAIKKEKNQQIFFLQKGCA